jgi:hypothetical protein
LTSDIYLEARIKTSIPMDKLYEIEYELDYGTEQLKWKESDIKGR